MKSVAVLLICLAVCQLAVGQNFAWQSWRQSQIRRQQPNPAAVVADSSAAVVTDEPVQEGSGETAAGILKLEPITEAAAVAASTLPPSTEAPIAQTTGGSSVDLVSALNGISQTVQAGDELKPSYVIIGFGPGCTTPKDYLSTDLASMITEGLGMLSLAGKKKSFDLGMFLRWRYPFIPQQYNPKELEVLTSSQPAALATMQTVLASLMLPQGRAVWNDNFLWQPAVFNVSDKILNLKSLNCKAVNDVCDDIESEMTGDAKNLLAQNSRLIQFVSEKTKWEPTLQKMAQVAANVIAMQNLNMSLPDWVEDNPYNMSLIKHIVAFSEICSLLCAKDQKCRQLAAGPLLGSIFKMLAEQNSNLRSTIYAGSLNEIAAVMQYLGIPLTMPLQSNAAFALEYAIKDNVPVIRGAYFNQVESDEIKEWVAKYFRFKACPNSDWCSLQEFLTNINQDIILNIDEVCADPTTPAPTTAAPAQCKQSAETNQAETGARIETLVGGNSVSILIDCTRETDESGTTYCGLWAEADYCKIYRSVREFYCRKTCLCNPKFRERSLGGIKRRS